MFSGILEKNEEDEDFFGILENSRTKLSNIFLLDSNQNQPNDNASLKYVPPKQAQIAEASSQDKSSDWNIQLAKVVTAFKLVNEDYVLQGKIGFAILKSRQAVELKIILYRTKNKILSTYTIDENAHIFLKNFYLQFRDDMQIFWSILFNQGDEQQVIEMLNENIVKDKTQSDENIQESSIQKARENGLRSEINDEVKSYSEAQHFLQESKSESYSSDERSRNSKLAILSRMAKMGQTFPKLSAKRTDFSDSSDNETKAKQSLKPVAVPRKVKTQQIMTVTQPVNRNSQTIASVTAFTPRPNSDAQLLNILLAENRAQNSEIRINISKLETKIERVLDKIDLIDSRHEKEYGKSNDDVVLNLEETVLMLKKKNRAMRIKMQEMENEYSKTKFNTQFTSSLKNHQNLLHLLNIDISELEKPEDIFSIMFPKVETYCKELKASLTESKESRTKCSNQLLSLKTEQEALVNEFNRKNADLASSLIVQQDISEKLALEKQICVKEKEEKIEEAKKLLDTTVKEIMNHLYQKLVENLQNKDNLSNTEMLRICGSAIKEETKKAFQKE